MRSIPPRRADPARPVPVRPFPSTAGTLVRAVAATTLATVALGLASVAPAGAQATFEGGGVQVDTDRPLTMKVTQDRGDARFNREVAIVVAAGWRAQSCATKDTWTCSVVEEDGKQIVRFTKSGTRTDVDNVTFGFVAHTATTPGTWSFPTTQTYDDGLKVEWNGDDDRPAPTIETVVEETSTTSTPEDTTPEPTTSIPSAGGPNSPSGGGPSAPPLYTPPPPLTTVPGSPTTTRAKKQPTNAGGLPSDPTVTTAPVDPTVATTSGGTTPTGTNTAAGDDRDEESAAALTPSDESGSAFPVVVGGIAVLAMVAVGGGLAVRQRAAAGAADGALAVEPAGGEPEPPAADDVTS